MKGLRAALGSLQEDRNIPWSTSACTPEEQGSAWHVSPPWRPAIPTGGGNRQTSPQICRKLTVREPGWVGNPPTCCTFSGLAEKPPHFLLPNYGFLWKAPQKQQLYLQGKAQLTKKRITKKPKAKAKGRKQPEVITYLPSETNPASQAIATKLTHHVQRELADNFKQAPSERSTGLLLLETPAPTSLQAWAYEFLLR